MGSQNITVYTVVAPVSACIIKESGSVSHVEAAASVSMAGKNVIVYPVKAAEFVSMVNLSVPACKYINLIIRSTFK
jgi:hypothetical protein